MSSKNIFLYKDFVPYKNKDTDGFVPFLRDFSLGNKSGAVIVCPGGGYGCVCRDREGEPIAQYFYANGFNACVLEYTVAPAKLGYLPAIEVGLAIKYMREHAEELGVDTGKIFIIHIVNI